MSTPTKYRIGTQYKRKIKEEEEKNQIIPPLQNPSCTVSVSSRMASSSSTSPTAGIKLRRSRVATPSRRGRWVLVPSPRGIISGVPFRLSPYIRTSSFTIQSHKSPVHPIGLAFKSQAQYLRRKTLKVSCSSNDGNPQEEYLIYAPESVGDGFSFSGGKYSDEPNPSDEWREQGKFVKAHLVGGTGERAKDPIFGLTMGAGSQASADVFRWFCVESGSANNHTVILIHGLPSQAYSYRKVLPTLSSKYHAIAFDWLGFGFSDKPQPRYGFDYTLDEYESSLESLVNEVTNDKVSLVVQGYFSPVVVKYASKHQEKLQNLILLNPPLTAKHANLPPTLSIFSNFLLGEIFCQDPLRASDKTLTSCGPYKMKEDDAMVYRRPYLTSGSAGFALSAISKAMKKELKASVEDMRRILMDKTWKVPTTVCWGMRDRWLRFDDVEGFCKDSNLKLVQLPMAGHHVQEDSGEELGAILSRLITKPLL